MSLPLIPLLLAGGAVWLLFSSPKKESDEQPILGPGSTPRPSMPIGTPGGPTESDFRRAFGELVKQGIADPLSLNAPSLEELRDLFMLNGMPDESKTMAMLLDKQRSFKNSPAPRLDPGLLRSQSDVDALVTSLRAHPEGVDTRNVDLLANFFSVTKPNWTSQLSRAAASIRLDRTTHGQPSDLPLPSAAERDRAVVPIRSGETLDGEARRLLSLEDAQTRGHLGEMKLVADRLALIGDQAFSGQMMARFNRLARGF